MKIPVLNFVRRNSNRLRGTAWIALITGVLYFIPTTHTPNIPQPRFEGVAEYQSMDASRSPVAMMLGGGQRAMAKASNKITNEKIIVTSRLNLEVTDTEDARKKVSTFVSEKQGKIDNMSSWEVRPGVLAYEFTIRVPSSDLESIITELTTWGEKKSESFNARNITESYKDTVAEVLNLEKQRNQLRKLMEFKTDKLSDVLAVSRELSRVQSQLDNLVRVQKGRDYDVAYSTLHLSVQPETQIGDIENPHWSITKSWKTALNKFINTIYATADKLIFLVVFLPLWGGVLALVWYMRRRYQ